MAWTTFVPASSVAVTLTNGNLTATATATTASTRSEDTFQFGSNNKLYFEITLNTTPNSQGFYGIAGTGYVSASGTFAGVLQSGAIWVNNVNTGFTSGAAFVLGDVVCCAFDLAHGFCWFRKNAGNWNNSATANPATGVGGVIIPASMAAFLAPFVRFGAVSEQATANFGASAFAQAVPSGFTAGWLTSAGTTALASQAAIEVWVGNPPSAIVSQVALELFGAFTTSPAAILTQFPLEVWAASASAPTGMTLALAATEQRDILTFHFSGGPPTLVLAATEQRDVASFWLAPPPTYVLAATERLDVAHFNIFDGTLLALHATERRDVAKFQVASTFAPFQVPGLGWSVHRRPTFDTIVVPHPSGADVRSALWANPLWEFELTFDGLAGDVSSYPGLGANSFQNLLGFYLTLGGGRDRFLYVDPDFFSVTAQLLGTGDGATTVFPLVRAFGGFVEQISWATGVSAVTVAGAPAAFSMPSPASIQLAIPPAAGALVAATFTYGFICRFLDDTLDFEEFMQNLWQLKSFKFRQVRL